MQTGYLLYKFLLSSFVRFCSTQFSGCFLLSFADFLDVVVESRRWRRSSGGSGGPTRGARAGVAGEAEPAGVVQTVNYARSSKVRLYTV